MIRILLLIALLATVAEAQEPAVRIRDVDDGQTVYVRPESLVMGEKGRLWLIAPIASRVKTNTFSFEIRKSEQDAKPCFIASGNNGANFFKTDLGLGTDFDIPECKR